MIGPYVDEKKNFGHDGIFGGQKDRPKSHRNLPDGLIFNLARV